MLQFDISVATFSRGKSSVTVSLRLSVPLQRLVWNKLLRELRKGSTVQLAAAIDAQGEDAVVLLRHLAACRLTGWSVHALCTSILHSLNPSQEHCAQRTLSGVH